MTSPSGPPPDGETVTFKDGTTTLGTGTLASGVATYTTSSLTQGTHSITAVFFQDAAFLGKTSTALSQVINNPTPTTTALTSSANPVFVNQSVTLTATVSRPGRRHSHRDRGLQERRHRARNRHPERRSCHPEYQLQRRRNTSVDGGLLGRLQQRHQHLEHLEPDSEPGDSTTVLITSGNPVAPGDPVHVHCDRSSNNGGPNSGAPADGTVISFQDNAAEIGTGLLSSGVASFTTTSLALGTHPMTGVFAGNAAFTASSSAPVSQQISSNSSAVVSISRPTRCS